ncbi:DUF2442 domain-containing protein [Candidatus Methylospira mobilis]|uniref:DUF2442 domain-containing protein n=1 Tax=Candidatus Methylospira mobilis TaxID=1808979 RepID=A0A5Q0BLZ5_9GAMM|nr:DUF2442 domain-containing protein [Candidatus Methylospira mobilis]QFY43127.1 DUF2442 domain-containing protein [Candidatus Methylospira mobilis]
MNTSIAGKTVSFDNRYLHVELTDGRIISTPLSWYAELMGASINDLNNYRFICQGTGIEWEAIDYHLSIESMLLGKSYQEAA